VTSNYKRMVWQTKRVTASHVEWGFVDESKLQCYKKTVLDDSGEIIPEFS
jgi:hypothetical protein